MVIDYKSILFFSFQKRPHQLIMSNTILHDKFSFPTFHIFGWKDIGIFQKQSVVMIGSYPRRNFHALDDNQILIFSRFSCYLIGLIIILINNVREALVIDMFGQ